MSCGVASRARARRRFVWNYFCMSIAKPCRPFKTSDILRNWSHLCHPSYSALHATLTRLHYGLFSYALLAAPSPPSSFGFPFVYSWDMSDFLLLTRSQIAERSLDRDDDAAAPAPTVTTDIPSASVPGALAPATSSNAIAMPPPRRKSIQSKSSSFRGSVMVSNKPGGHRRRLSTYESDYGADPEGEESGGSARPSLTR